MKELHAKLDGHPLVDEIRGMGLMVGVALKTDGAPVMRAMAQKGVLVNAAALTVIRMVPPLIITKEELARAVEVLTEVLDEHQNEPKQDR